MTSEMEHRLLSCRSISEFLAMYFGLSNSEKLSVFTEDVTISKGDEFYRIRRAEGIKDPNDPQEWGPAPRSIISQGRLNSKGESVLYIASTPDALEREVKLKDGEEYYLARYICNEPFIVSSFLGGKSRVNSLLHKIAMSIANEGDLTDTEKDLIEKYYKLVRKQPLEELALDMLAPLYIYKLLPKIYDATNKLGKLLFKKNGYGIRYSSVYAPMELSGVKPIITLNGLEYGNYALTAKGYDKIDFISAEPKKCERVKGLEVMIKTFSKTNKNH